MTSSIERRRRPPSAEPRSPQLTRTSWLISAIILSWSCSPAPSGSLALTSEGKDLAAQKAELDRFLRIRVEPLEIFYDGWVHDNSSGLVPGPSDWEVVGWIRAAPADLAVWADRLPEVAEIAASKDLAEVLDNMNLSRDELQWHQGPNATLGFARGLMVFRVVTQ
jgi:hypothetical protein